VTAKICGPDLEGLSRFTLAFCQEQVEHWAPRGFMVTPLLDPTPRPCHILPGSELDSADAFGASRTSWSFLLAVYSSTINKAIEYIVTKVPLCSTA